MATAEELFGLRNDSALRNRVMSEVLIAAEGVVGESDTTPNHTNRLVWAKRVFVDPDRETGPMFMALLAASSDLTVVQIQGATDAQILVSVGDHVDLFADGGS